SRASSSPSRVESTRSTKTTVATLRSSGPASSATGSPQFGQKRAPAGIGVPQRRQPADSAVPQLEQKRLPAGFSVAQVGQARVTPLHRLLRGRRHHPRADTEDD